MSVKKNGVVLFLPVSLIVLIISCDPTLNTSVSNLPAEPAIVESGLMKTDTSHYQAAVENGKRIEVEIPFVVTNTTGEEIYMIGCRRPAGPVLQKLNDGEWITAYAGIELSCLSPPWILAPDETFRDTLHVNGYIPGQNIYPTIDTEIEGKYRLMRPFYTRPETYDKPSGEREQYKLPDSLGISNTFLITNGS